MSAGTATDAGQALTRALDAAFAAYREHYGRARADERLRLMLMRSFEAQATEDFNTENRAIGRAAE